MAHADIPDDLLRLAAAHQVEPDYRGHDGLQHRASADTVRKVLAALGVDASTPERVHLALAHVENMPWRRVLPPVVVVRQGRHAHVPVHVTHGDPVRVWVEIDPEAGGGRREVPQADVVVDPRSVDGRLVGRATFTLPADLPLGWHEMHAVGPSGSAHSPVVVTPDRLHLPEAVAHDRAWGLMAQLYSVRSRASWGVGDLADLAELCWLAGDQMGADFVLINPLHAAEPVEPLTPSPYLPTTRRFVNPLYVRVEDVREAGYLSAADRSLVEWAAEPVLPLDSDPGPIDRDVAWAAKRAALEVVFAHPRSPARQAAFEAFVEEQGEGLRTFALWCALLERHGPVAGWPAELRDPASPAVAAAAEELADRVELWTWLQWVADEQLARAQQAARDAGMAIGVMHDLAVGVHPEGSDAWALQRRAGHRRVGRRPAGHVQPAGPGLVAAAVATRPRWPAPRTGRTATCCAPCCGTPAPSASTTSSACSGCGGSPQGNGAADGAYVRYDHEALVGILALEAHRAGAVVIGEDLGTVEPWVRDYLADRGVLGTSVLWFEQDVRRRAAAPRALPRRWCWPR